jgi:hypothetical protein
LELLLLVEASELDSFGTVCCRRKTKIGVNNRPFVSGPAIPKTTKYIHLHLGDGISVLVMSKACYGSLYKDQQK